MYDLNDKEKAITKIQQYLSLYSEANPDFPHLSIDGIYSDETEEAVRCFQLVMNLPKTGIVDYITWNTLYSEYKKIKALENDSKNVFDLSVFPLNLGDHGSDVKLLNTYITELAEYYPDLTKAYSDFYSYNTAISVRLLKDYFREPINSSVDPSFIARLNTELISRQKFNKHK